MAGGRVRTADPSRFFTEKPAGRHFQALAGIILETWVMFDLGMSAREVLSLIESTDHRLFVAVGNV